MEAQKQPSPWRSGLRIGAILGAAIGIWMTRHAGSAPPKSVGEVLARAERAGFPPAMIATFMLWLVVGIYWELAARGAKDTRSREAPASRFVHLTLVTLGQVLLLFPLPGPLRGRFMPAMRPVIAAGLVIEAASVALMVWARRVLGRNWSGAITTKVGHELVRTGPYRRVRHPIYSGMLGLSLGTMLVVGEWRAVAGLAVLAIAFARKIAMEEKLLGDLFGPAWTEYRGTTKAVVPWLV